MVLADTTVWVDHFRNANSILAELMRSGEVACHPFIIGELACGNLPKRQETLGLLGEFPSLKRATDAEVLALIENNRLMGLGLNLVDVSLLASCVQAGVPLWTRDKALAAAAARLGIAATD